MHLVTYLQLNGTVKRASAMCVTRGKCYTLIQPHTEAAVFPHLLGLPMLYSVPVQWLPCPHTVKNGTSARELCTCPCRGRCCPLQGLRSVELLLLYAMLGETLKS
jgi:hypothetical protein